MATVIDINEKITKNFKERDLNQREKFLYTSTLIDEDSLKVLEDHGITLTKNSQLITLVLDPKTLTQTLSLATEMGFVDAYKENPKRLTQLVKEVAKRVSQCNVLGIPLKNEQGKYEDFLFRERLFKARLATLSSEQKKAIAVPTSNINEENQNIDLTQVKEYALRILEQFAITEQKEAIYNRIDEIKESGLGVKEMLMEAFKICAGNTELLSDAIDQVLEQDKQLSLREVA